MHITEDLLYFIWRFLYFDITNLSTTDSEPITLIESGHRNTNAGPDFQMAKIKINDQLWIGNVEIHVSSSDWNLHQHSTDAAFNNVILHIVWNNDISVHNHLGLEIPCLELKDKVDHKLISQYQYLMENEEWIPCAKRISTISDITKQSFLSRLMAERLEQKSQSILDALDHTTRDWESVCYQKLTRALAGQVNGDTMELLARITPLNILYKHKDNLLQIEAVLFGQSGLLHNLRSTDDYILKLQQEYSFLESKYSLTPIDASQWKFLRMRPANFPTIRIAQLARILFQTDLIFSKFVSAHNVHEVKNMLDVTISQYWKNHYSFESESTAKEKHLGKETIHHIIINTIAPLLFAYGISTANEEYKDKAIFWLENLPAEKNAIIQSWANHSWLAQSAMDSQALLQLKKYYCSEKKCLQCAIGHQLIKKTA